VLTTPSHFTLWKKIAGRNRIAAQSEKPADRKSKPPCALRLARTRNLALTECAVNMQRVSSILMQAKVGPGHAAVP